MFLHLPSRLILLFPTLLSLLLAACAVGPDYVKPSVETPAAFTAGEGWKLAQPNDTALPGKWWELFGDPTLNKLVAQVTVSNQELAQAEAQYRQAKALAEASKAGLYPTVTVGAGATRARSSANVGRGGGTANDFLLPANLTWEADLWGRIRRSIEAGTANMQASAADLAAAQLSLQAELAADYFQLRALDAQKQFLDESIGYLQKSLELTRNRYTAGVAAKSDVLQADNLLKSTQASMVDLGVQRAQLEHAIALLIGKPARSVALPLMPLTQAPPAIPVGVPSELLERRPDIAAAEQRMVAANAQIGIARAAYYPTLKLGTSIGFETADLATWFSWPSRFWSIGPSAAATIFDGGLRASQNAQALAAYDASIAAYRQTVLTAFKEVEDNLAALRILAEENRIQDDAVESARQSVTIVRNQYQAGTVAYLNVIVAQTTELSDRRTAIGILGRRLNAAVLLVKALGGGWSNTQLQNL